MTVPDVDHDCGPEPHTHPVHGTLWFKGVAVIMDSRISVLVPDGAKPLADRICQLLIRHGLCDIPDTIEEVA